MLQIRRDNLKNIFLKHERIVLFGAGTLTSAMFEAYKDLGFEKKVDYILDNDKEKDGKTVNLNGKAIPMLSPERFAGLGYQDYVLLIMPVFMLDIVQQMDSIAEFDNIPAYIYAFAMNEKERGTIPFSFRNTKEPCIPRILHYFWFGKKEMPDKYKKNLESWRRYCLGFKLIRWDESNYDYKKVPFMSQAYETRQWAYVTDYARKDVIYNHGGIYLDTDVELVKPIDDLLYNDFFVCRDDVANINTGSGFGAVKGEALVKALRDDYLGQRFVDSSGQIVGKACGVYETAVLIKFGYQPDNTFQKLGEGEVVFTRDVLCPISWIGMPNTYSQRTIAIHKYDDLLIDGKGKEEASKRRAEIISLINRSDGKYAVDGKTGHVSN